MNEEVEALKAENKKLAEVCAKYSEENMRLIDVLFDQAQLLQEYSRRIPRKSLEKQKTLWQRFLQALFW